MLDRFTLATQNMLKLAAREARPLRAHRLGSEHVLLALCSRCGATTKLLAGAGVTVDRVSARIEPLDNNLRSIPRGIRIPFSPRVQGLLVRALALAPADRDLLPGTDVVLLALMLDEGGSARGVLDDLKTDVPALRDATITRIAEWDPGILRRVSTENARWAQPHVVRAAAADPFAATPVDALDGLIAADRRVLDQLRPQMTQSSQLASNDDLLYSRLVRMVQPTVSRYPLLEGNGNFGNIDGFDPAGSQYTEARASPFLADAASVPMILINGAPGIPPHNLAEITNTVEAYLANPGIPAAALLNTLQGPDFPTGGIITNPDGLAGIYETGAGEFTLRGRVQIESGKAGCRLVVTELPYAVNKGTGVREQILAAVRSETLTEIIDVNDESDLADGMRLVLALAAGADPEAVLEALYLQTSLEITVPVRLEASIGGTLRALNLAEILAHWVTARRAAIGDHTIYAELEQVRARHADRRRTTLR